MAAKRTDIHKLRDQLVTSYDARSVMMASDMPRHPRYSTGSLSLDFATGVGGWPSDRLIEVFGTESCGKTTLGLLGMSNFLDAQPKRCALVLDTEHKLDIDWLATLVGADRLENRVIYLQPDDIEQATQMYKEAVASGLVCFTLFDSIASSTTRKSVQSDKDEMTGNAKAMARFAPIMGAFSAKYQCCTFAVNQTREDIAGFHRILTPGGRAPKHAAALRVYLKQGKGEIIEEINGEKVKVGYPVVAKIVKNQVGGIEGRTCQYWFMNVATDKWGFGVDQTEEISRLGLITGVIERKGGWYYHEDLPGGKILGADILAKQVKADPGLRQKLTATIMARLSEHAHEVAPITDPEASLEEEPPVAPLLPQED
jgi:recombination protein RecA